MKNDFEEKLGNISGKIETEKREKANAEEQRKKKEHHERMASEQRQRKRVAYVEGKIKEFTGLNKFVLTQAEINNNLDPLYEAFAAINAVKKEKRNRGINLNAKKVTIHGEDVFWDEDIVLEAKIRKLFTDKIKESLSYYEQKALPKITGVDIYFAYIGKIMRQLCEFYYNFLKEFDAVDNDFDSIYEYYVVKWTERDYSHWQKLERKLRNAADATQSRLNKQYKYDESYEPMVYNGRGLSNAIDAKFQSEMWGAGINFLRMVGNNAGKFAAVGKLQNVVDDVSKQMREIINVTSRFICSWGEDLINDAINTLKQKQHIQISIVDPMYLLRIENFLSGLSDERWNSKDRNIFLDKIYCINPFCIKGSDDDKFDFFLDAVEFLNIEHFFVIEYNIRAESEISSYTKEIKGKSTFTKADLDALQNRIKKYKLIERAEYNQKVKDKTQKFIATLDAILSQQLDLLDKKNRTVDGTTYHTLEQADNAKKNIQSANNLLVQIEKQPYEELLKIQKQLFDLNKYPAGCVNAYIDTFNKTFDPIDVQERTYLEKTYSTYAERCQVEHDVEFISRTYKDADAEYESLTHAIEELIKANQFHPDAKSFVLKKLQDKKAQFELEFADKELAEKYVVEPIDDFSKKNIKRLKKLLDTIQQDYGYLPDYPSVKKMQETIKKQQEVTDSAHNKVVEVVVFLLLLLGIVTMLTGEIFVGLIPIALAVIVIQLFFKSPNSSKGNAQANANLEKGNDSGQGVTPDNKEVRQYQKAAEKGDACAQNDLGWCYYKGEGVTRDYNKAVYWYQKAANQGNTQAQCNLGICYEFGKGVAQDYKKAVYWYQKAADRGNARAQCYLGICYKNGEGVTQD